MCLDLTPEDPDIPRIMTDVGTCITSVGRIRHCATLHWTPKGPLDS